MDDLDLEECSMSMNMTSGEGHDPWGSKYSPWEEDCINQVEGQPDLEPQLEAEKDHSSHKLWLSFQSAACCIAQLYKDRHQGPVSLWIPFQTAASSVTSLYKECTDSEKRFAEMGYQSGLQRRNKELLGWVKKRKRHIRREDLLTFLSGRNGNSVPSGNGYHHFHNHHNLHHLNRSSNWGLTTPRQRLALAPESGTAPGGASRPSAHHNVTLTRLSLSESSPCPSLSNGDANDLQTFREALALSGETRSAVCSQRLTSSLPPVAGLRNPPQGNSTTTNTTKRSGSSRVTTGAPNGANSGTGTASGSSLAELNAFITEEFTRHVEARKRSATSTDVIMDSPTHKRPKFV